MLKSQYASDINECAQDESKCYYHSHCVNTEGSYKCICDSGYAPWGRLCVGESLDMIIIYNGKVQNGRKWLCLIITYIELRPFMGELDNSHKIMKKMLNRGQCGPSASRIILCGQICYLSIQFDCQIITFHYTERHFAYLIYIYI